MNIALLNTSLYTSLLIFLYLYLSFRVIGKRRSLKISIGHSENPDMLRAMRAHANFIEYTPLALFCMGLLELSGIHSLIIHFLGILLLVGRSLHAYGVSQSKENFKFRVSGMMMTFSHLFLCSIFMLTNFFKS